MTTVMGPRRPPATAEGHTHPHLPSSTMRGSSPLAPGPALGPRGGGGGDRGLSTSAGSTSQTPPFHRQRSQTSLSGSSACDSASSFEPSPLPLPSSFVHEAHSHPHTSSSSAPSGPQQHHVGIHHHHSTRHHQHSQHRPEPDSLVDVPLVSTSTASTARTAAPPATRTPPVDTGLDDSSYVLHSRILPPRPSSPSSDDVEEPASRSLQQSRFSALNSLTRAATQRVKAHARSQSLFSLPAAITTPPASPSPSRSVSSSTFSPSVDDMSTTTKSLFGFLSKAPPPRGPLPATTDLIDEFSGLNFQSLVNSYLAPPSADATPEEAAKQTPEARLQELVTTASDLLTRVYSAYRARTSTLADALGELEIAKEEAANSRVRTENLKVQLDRQTHCTAAAESRIRSLEAELAQEKHNVAAAEERKAEQRERRGKRVSAASDSGFESDCESCFSREDTATLSGAPGVVEEIPANGTNPRVSVSASPALSPTSAEGFSQPKVPSTLRDSWSSDGTQQTANTTGGGRWSLFGRKNNDNTDVRSENRHLRQRVAELEGAVDAALEAVQGRFDMQY